MPRTAVRALVGALAAGAALTPAVASAQAPSAALRVHAIFTGGGDRSTFHLGEVLFTDVPNAGGRKLTQVCFSPAPISRPGCSASRVAAPSALGATAITATLSDGTKLTRTISVIEAAKRVGGPRAVPATITCRAVTLFGNYDQRRHKSRDPRGTIQRGDRVAMFNRIAPGKIFMWDYRTNLGGFGSERCAQP
ncbi:MAG: hypothetical protein QOH72_1610 [Solirubrobacteraceae bacterium]|jgi:hypothetical protein|nr:hypothetical protein [Solirubrobacteraceae bacterium]